MEKYHNLKKISGTITCVRVTGENEKETINAQLLLIPVSISSHHGKTNTIFCLTLTLLRKTRGSSRSKSVTKINVRDVIESIDFCADLFMNGSS